MCSLSDRFAGITEGFFYFKNKFKLQEENIWHFLIAQLVFFRLW